MALFLNVVFVWLIIIHPHINVIPGCWKFCFPMFLSLINKPYVCKVCHHIWSVWMICSINHCRTLWNSKLQCANAKFINEANKKKLKIPQGYRCLMVPFFCCPHWRLMQHLGKCLIFNHKPSYPNVGSTCRSTWTFTGPRYTTLFF